MPFYPAMSALLDIERLTRGLGDLHYLEHYEPAEDTCGRHWYPAATHRHKPLHELAKSLEDDLAWVNERGLTLEDEVLQPDGYEHVLKFLLRGPGGPDDYIDVEIDEEAQLSLTSEQRKRWAVATVQFHGDGWQWKFTLGSTHPGHDTMQTFLAAVQPVHCDVDANVISPVQRDSIPHSFPARWAKASSNCFLGPELTRRIPPELLTVEAGLAYVARPGNGTWITLPGDETNTDREVRERHIEAIERLQPFMPPASPFDPSLW